MRIKLLIAAAMLGLGVQGAVASADHGEAQAQEILYERECLKKDLIKQKENLFKRQKDDNIDMYKQWVPKKYRKSVKEKYSNTFIVLYGSYVQAQRNDFDDNNRCLLDIQAQTALEIIKEHPKRFFKFELDKKDLELFTELNCQTINNAKNAIQTLNDLIDKKLKEQSEKNEE